MIAEETKTTKTEAVTEQAGTVLVKEMRFYHHWSQSSITFVTSSYEEIKRWQSWEYRLNFLIESTNQNFDEGTVYELTTAEAKKSTQRQALRLARNGWSLFLIAGRGPKVYLWIGGIMA